MHADRKEKKKMLEKPSLSQSYYDVFPVDSQELFTELTSEEAAIIEGGSFIELSQIAILNSKSEAENLCLYVDNEQFWFASIKDRSVLKIDRKVNFQISAFVELYENCGDGEKGNLVGYFEVPGAAVASETKYLEGSESKYLINYRVFS